MKHKKKLVTAATAFGITSAAALYAERKILSSLFERDDQWMKGARDGKRYAYEWFDDKGANHRYIEAHDHVRLHAYELPQSIPTHRYMIMLHGFHGYVKELSYEAKHFYEMGYHLILPSMRAHGMSEGAMITMGILEHLDVCRWMEEVRRTDPQAQITLYGVSMGAATTLLTLAKPQGEWVRAAIADCPYARVIDVFDYYLSKRLHLPYRWYLYACNELVYHKSHISLKEARPIDVVDQIKTPLLLIHGDADDLVPYSMMDELYQKVNGPKQKLTIPHAGHALSSSYDPDTYWQCVDAFLKRYSL